MPENKEDIRLQYLFQQYLTNQISGEEYVEFWHLLQQGREKNALSAELQALWEKALYEKEAISKEQWDEKMRQLINRTEMAVPTVAKIHKASKTRFYKWIAAAAILLILVIGGGMYFYNKRPARQQVIVKHVLPQEKNNISPGGNKAILVLSNGSRIVLDSAANGLLSRQGKTSIIKSDSGKIAYNPSGTTSSDVVYNMLRTPRGGKYQLELSDGTKVWLNAASSLRFPTSFPGDKRIVEMTGEAYFEVAGNPEKPFIVSVNGMKVRVLGTHFNIMAYDDEPVVKTTLLEGAVSVKKEGTAVLLKPGQQARMNKKGEVQVLNNANVNKAVAWKNNLFWFDENNIYEVMRQVSRWYNADVVIKGNIPQHFTGSIPRNVEVFRVLEILQGTGNIRFKVESHKIIVTP